MAEKLSEVFDQYDMDIVKLGKGRGATIITTSKGMRILEPFRGNVIRLEQEYVLKKLFVKEGFNKIDSIIPNREGQLITCDRYRQPYVLKEHFEGEECDMKEIDDVLRSINVLSKFHICGKKVALDFQSEWESEAKEKEEKRLSEIKKALADGAELERVAHIYDIREAVLREMLKRTENADTANQKNAMDNGLSVVYKDVCEMFNRHNRELKKIYKFISSVKQKNAFENLFRQVFLEFYEQGLDCVKMLDEQNVAKQVYEKHYGICHGSYNQHNVILGADSEAIVHFERFSKGNQLDDLYQFSRKVMEKNHFDLAYLEALLEEYNKRIPLDTDDYRYIYVLFSYPEKFWKIANGYYNTNKAFLSPKYVEKLNAVIEQEKEKREMLDKFFAFHLD